MEESFVLWAAPVVGFVVSMAALLGSKISASRFEKKWGANSNEQPSRNQLVISKDVVASSGRSTTVGRRAHKKFLNTKISS